MQNDRRKVLTLLLLLRYQRLARHEFLETHSTVQISRKNFLQQTIHSFVFNCSINDCIYFVLVHFANTNRLFREKSQPYLTHVPY